MKSLLDPARLKSLQDCVRAVKRIPGAIVEIGVYKGGSLKAIAAVETDKKILGIDSFEGLVEVTPNIDTHKIGDFGDSDFETVKNLMAAHKNVEVLKGIFPIIPWPFETVSLFHIDVDTYESTRSSLWYSARYLEHGGVVVCDDYGAVSCPGARIAVNEFLGVMAKSYHVINVVNSQIVLVKL